MPSRRSRIAQPAPRILVRADHPRGTYAARVLRTHARRFLELLARPDAELSIVVSTDAQIRKLNRDWRQKDKATDVLSFEQDAKRGLLGDVVISLDTAARQAREGALPLTVELARLLAHGLLHLLGHDHEEPADARRMAAAEVDLLGRFGLVGDALAHPSLLDFRRAQRQNPPKRSRPSPRSQEN